MTTETAAPADARGTTLGSAILFGWLAAGMVVVTGIEALSALHAVRQSALLGLAALAMVVGLAVVLRTVPPGGGLDLFGRHHRGLLTCLSAIGALTLLTALLAPPNTWDSMTYHMARVAAWYDHGTVAHYATGIDRQLWQPPFGEYLVLVGYGALGGRDYLANIPGWLAGAGAVLAATEIARLLGASRRARCIVALLTASAPTLILHASSTHTDLLGGFWIAVAAWLALAEFLSPSRTARSAFWFGAALALAIGTKGTAIPLGLPWLLVFLGSSFRPFRARLLFSRILVVGVVVLALNGLHFLRNLSVFDTPLGPASVQELLRPVSLEAGTVFSNLLAHSTLQIGTPWPELNSRVARGVASIHSALGLDLERLYPYFGGFRIGPWSTFEDRAGNPVHLVLGLAGFAVLAVRWRRSSFPERIAAMAFLSSVIFFAMAVRWQPFVARLHTPFLVLLAPCILLALERQVPRIVGLGTATAVLLALPSLFVNGSRPLVTPHRLGLNWPSPRSIAVESRETLYFANRPALQEPYAKAIALIAAEGCGRVSLKTGYDSWEYPLWVLGRRHGVTFEHLLHERESRTPCAIIGLDQPVNWRPNQIIPDQVPLMFEGPVTVWR